MNPLTPSPTLARREVPLLPAYNAGLSSDAVRKKYGVADIARLASNESPFGASPTVAKALVSRRSPKSCVAVDRPFDRAAACRVAGRTSRYELIAPVGTGTQRAL